MVPCSITSLGYTVEMRLTGNKDADNSTFLKASLLEVVMDKMFGFKLLSNVTDDFRHGFISRGHIAKAQIYFIAVTIPLFLNNKYMR
jgi:hypothetical protein